MQKRVLFSSSRSHQEGYSLCVWSPNNALLVRTGPARHSTSRPQPETIINNHSEKQRWCEWVFLLICKTTQKQQRPGRRSLIKTLRNRRANSQQTEMCRCKCRFPVIKSIRAHLQEWQRAFLGLVFSPHSNGSALTPELLFSPDRLRTKSESFASSNPALGTRIVPSRTPGRAQPRPNTTHNSKAALIGVYLGD